MKFVSVELSTNHNSVLAKAVKMAEFSIIRCIVYMQKSDEKSLENNIKYEYVYL